MKPVFGAFISSEKPSYGDILGDTLQLESLGYDSVWISDHVYGMYLNPGDPRYECWTTMSALAVNTSTIRLGQLVLCNPFRHPPLLAKMAATLDSISDGRLLLGLGTGWHEGEFKAYGYDLGSPASRVRRLDEAARIIKLMWTEDAPSFQGRYYSIEGAYCSPRPKQRPHPPLMLAGGGEKLTLRTVARHADMSNYAAWMGTPDVFKAKSDTLDACCRQVGRDPGKITRSWACYALISCDRGKADMSLERYTQSMQARYGNSAMNMRPPLAGTPGEVIKQVQQYVDAGVSYFIVRFMGESFKDEAELFAEEVTPSFT